MSYSPNSKERKPRVLVITKDGQPDAKIAKHFGNRVTFLHSQRDIAVPWYKYSGVLPNHRKKRPPLGLPWWLGRQRWEVCVVMGWGATLQLNHFMAIMSYYCPTTLIAIGGHMTEVLGRTDYYHIVSSGISLRKVDELIKASKHARKCLCAAREQIRKLRWPDQVLEDLEVNFTLAIPAANRKAIKKAVGRFMLQLAITHEQFRAPDQLMRIVCCLIEHCLMPQSQILKILHLARIKMDQPLRHILTVPQAPARAAH